MLQHIALQEYRDTIDETERRLDRITAQLRQFAPTWRWAPVVAALTRGGRPSCCHGWVHRAFGNLQTWLRGTHHGVGHKHLHKHDVTNEPRATVT